MRPPNGRWFAGLALAIAVACLSIGCSGKFGGFVVESEPPGIFRLEVEGLNYKFDAVKLATETVKAGRGIVSVFIPTP